MTQWIDGVYTSEAGVRSYRLYMGSPRRRGRPPLFVMLHGCDQDATGFAAGTRMNELADEFHGVVLYPEQSRMVNPMGCWNWHDVRHQSAAHGEPSLIAGMTRQVIEEHAIDPARVYVAGMSAGGAMAVILGQEYPDLYAAVGVHSGMPSGVATDLMSALRTMSSGPDEASAETNPRPFRRIPTIVFHGDEDRTVHPSNGEAIHKRSGARRPRKASAIPASPVRSSETHTREMPGLRAVTLSNRSRDGVSDAELWMVHGGGHAWAGGSPTATYTESRGPDASREMVRFFLQQRLDGPRKSAPRSRLKAA